jgi:plastocyanin
MKEHDNDGDAHDAPAKDEVRSVAGPLLARGESYSFTFNDAGSIPYHCSPHPYMKGSVTVVE